MSGLFTRLLCAAVLVLPLSAKTITVPIEQDGRTATPPPEINAGDRVVFSSGDKTLKYPAVEVSALTDLDVKTFSCDDKTLQSMNVTGTVTTKKADAAIIFAVCSGPNLLRVGNLILGPRREFSIFPSHRPAILPIRITLLRSEICRF